MLLKLNPLVLRLILFTVIPALVFGIVLVRYLQSSLPETQGNIRLTGIESQVQVSRDAHGVVFIDAKHDQDVYFAMGFVHAQDRLWQLEIQRRIAMGRMSEAFGKEYLDYDIWMRTLGFHNSAQQALVNLSPEAQQSLSSYAAGINAWLQSTQYLPPEFDMFDITPQPWTEVDSLAWFKVFALGLSQSLWVEAEYFAAQKILPEKHLSVLFPSYPKGAPVNIEFDEAENKLALQQLLDLKQGLETHLNLGGEYVGSNAWAISGKHTKDGAPILAADPHLGLQAPSLWYMVNQKGQNLNVSGMSLVGLPLVVFGRNDSIAWAGTSMMADTQDLYFEKVHPFETNKYQDGDVWREFETRVEKIEIKSEMPAFINRKIKPVEVKLRSTVRGPVVSDVVQGFDFPISLSWTALQSNDTTYNGLYELSYAQNWDAFKAALGQMVAPTLNLLYVDNDDNIGFLGVGDIPIRKKGDGRYPVPGWEPEYRWTGMIPAEHMPASLNPEKGYIVSANNKIIDDSYPYFISHDWAPPSRARRIEQLLEQKLSDGLSMQDIQIMQADTMDLGMHEVVTQALEILGPQPGLDEVLSLLKNWDGDMSQNSVAGSIAYTWLEFLSGELFGDDLEDYWNSKYSNSINNINARLGYTNIRLALMDDSYDWCDNRLTEEQESCELPLKTALENTIKRLKKLKGGNMDNWQWGDLHFSVYDHTPLSQSRLFQSIFERRAVGGGSAGSINVSNAIFDESKGYAQHFGASFRQIIKMHQTDKAHLYMNSMGQSSHVMSEHYDDMVLPFASVQYYSMPNKANHSSQQILLLTPVDNQGN